MEDQSGSSRLGKLSVNTLLLLFLTLVVWVVCYVAFGESAALSPSETGVIALVIALVLFAIGRGISKLRQSRKSATKTDEVRKANKE